MPFSKIKHVLQVPRSSPQFFPTPPPFRPSVRRRQSWGRIGGRKVEPTLLRKEGEEETDGRTFEGEKRGVDSPAEEEEERRDGGSREGPVLSGRSHEKDVVDRRCRLCGLCSRRKVCLGPCDQKATKLRKEGETQT